MEKPLRTMARRRPTIYLAGPISGCNDAQRHAWRNEIKQEYGHEFDFIDPTDFLVPEDGSEFALVEADAKHIRKADAVLANMWRESIGTAIGVVHAHSQGKIVVVCDPNLIGNRTLSFYADTTERTLSDAIEALRTLLAISTQFPTVRKAGGGEEPFDREKLMLSIRKACIAAKQSDIVPASAIWIRALTAILQKHDGAPNVKTSEIKSAVWSAIAQLAADPGHEADFEEIRLEWERHEAGKSTSRGRASRYGVKVHLKPLDVPLEGGGGHTLMWGKHEVGERALPIFDAIRCVGGITRIRFKRFSRKGQPPARPHVRLSASSTPGVIDGQCFDNAKKGTCQEFQIVTVSPNARDEVLKTLRKHLENLGYMRSSPFKRG